MNEEIFRTMAASIMEGAAEGAQNAAIGALEAGIDPLEAINAGFIVGLDKVGELFSAGEAFLPDLVMAGEAMKAAVNTLEPEMAKRGMEHQILGKVVLGTVEGDIHDIGKSLVAMMLSVAGFKVFDLGVDVPVIALVEKAREENADLIGVSALLTTTMTKQRDVVEALEDMNLRGSIKVIVGGAPTTQAWADEIGADGYSEDAVGAVALAKKMIASTTYQKE